MFSLLFVLPASGCVSASRFHSESAHYRLTANQADLTMQRALVEAWSEKFPVSRLPGQRLGYEFTVWFASDADKMVVEALRDGDGYVFSVGHDLEAPYEGVAARERILRLLDRYARLIEASGEGEIAPVDAAVVGGRVGL